MKITEISVIPLSYAYGEDPVAGRLQIPRRYFSIIKISTDEGLVGWGEASDCYGHHLPLTLKTYIKEQLQWWLLDQDPSDGENLMARLQAQCYRYQGNTELVMQALSAVEMAIWDIRGKALDLPIYKLLGAHREKIQIYVGGRPSFHVSAEQHLEWLQPHLARGVKAVKIRIGNNFVWDAQFVRNMRKILPLDTRVLVDGKYNYTPDSAIKMSYILAEEGIDCFEEPVVSLDLRELARVAAASHVPLAYGEHSYNIYDFRELITRNIARVLNPDASICGGITNAVNVSKLAQTFGFRVIPHCGGLTAIGLAANLHAAAAMPEMDLFEFDSREFQPLRDELPTEPIFAVDRIVDGYMSLPDKPGLGLDINESVFDKYPYQKDKQIAQAFYPYAIPHI